MFALALNLSICVFIALVFLLTEAVVMVGNLNPPMLFFEYAYKTMVFYIAWNGLIALSLIWGN